MNCITMANNGGLYWDNKEKRIEEEILKSPPYRLSYVWSTYAQGPQKLF